MVHVFGALGLCEGPSLYLFNGFPSLRFMQQVDRFLYFVRKKRGNHGNRLFLATASKIRPIDNLSICCTVYH